MEFNERFDNDKLNIKCGDLIDNHSNGDSLTN